MGALDCRTDWFRTRRDATNGVEALQAALMRYAYGRHAHSTYSVGVAERGSQTFHHRGATYASRPGSVILFAPFEQHDGHATDSAGVVYRMLYLDPAALEAALAESGLSGEIGFRAPLADDPRLASAILAYGCALDGAPDALDHEERYVSLVGELARHCLGRRPVGEPAAAALGRARDLTQAALTEPITISRLAEEAGVDRFRLIRAFGRRYGLPPSAYVRTVRLEAAKRLLAAGLAPAKAAVDTGFADQAHLTRHFKSAYGVTPGVYRAALAA